MGETARVSRGFGGQQRAWRESRRGFLEDLEGSSVLGGRAGEDFSRIWRAAVCLAGEPARILDRRAAAGGDPGDEQRPTAILETSTERILDVWDLGDGWRRRRRRHLRLSLLNHR